MAESLVQSMYMLRSHAGSGARREGGFYGTFTGSGELCARKTALTVNDGVNCWPNQIIRLQRSICSASLVIREEEEQTHKS
jgi:hypothetical protein